MGKLLAKYNLSFDISGILLSAICGLHCIITPILIISAPALGAGFQSLWVHSALFILMGIAFYQSVFKQFKRHESKLIFGLGLSGFAFLLITFFVELFNHEAHSHGVHHSEVHVDAHGHHHAHGHVDETWVAVMAIVGAILLISSHIMNIRNCQCAAEEANDAQ